MDVHVIIWIRGGKYKGKVNEKNRIRRGGLIGRVYTYKIMT